MLILDTDHPGPVCLRCPGQEDSRNSDGTAIQEYWLVPSAIAAISPDLMTGSSKAVIHLACSSAVIRFRYLTVAKLVEQLQLETAKRK